jgi:hypothetical protein
MDPAFWSSLCDRSISTCRSGAFAPSGYMLKAILLHAGKAVDQYSDPVHDGFPTRLKSFVLSKEVYYFRQAYSNTFYLLRFEGI